MVSVWRRKPELLKKQIYILRMHVSMNQFVLHIHSISQEIKYKVLMQSRKPPKSSKNYHYRGFRVMFLASDFHLFFFNAPGHLLGYSATATVRALALCPSA